MKTAPLSITPAFSLITALFFLFYGPFLLPAQDLEQVISSKLVVNDEEDFQILGSNTYRLSGQNLYQTPNTIRLFENNAYRFDISFSYFADKMIIDADNYRSRACDLRVPGGTAAKYMVRDIDPKDGIISVHASTIGRAGTKDTLWLQLLDKNTAKMLAEVIFPIEIQRNDPSANTTAFLPMEMRYQPLFITLEDVDNSNNRIERQLLPFFPDTINVDANDVFNLLLEVEQEVYINDQAYVLVADSEKDYGYQARIKWEGQSLRYKPASSNQLKSYLTVAPGRDRPGAITPPDMKKLLAANLQKAGLTRKGSRVKQQLNFVLPKEKIKKIYPSMYLKKNPEMSSYRLDHKNLASLVEKNKSKLTGTYLRSANIRLITAAKLSDAANLKIKPQPSVRQPSSTKTKIKPSVRTTPQKMKMQNARIVTKERPVKQKEKLAANSAITRVKVLPKQKVPAQSPYYTFSIEVSRKTDPMAFQTYLVTFRVVK